MGEQGHYVEITLMIRHIYPGSGRIYTFNSLYYHLYAAYPEDDSGPWNSGVAVNNIAFSVKGGQKKHSICK